MSYSIADIARRAGVSKATVSRVINHISKGVSEATRDRVLAVAREMNYRPNLQARAIAKSRSGIIGVIIPDVGNLFYPQLLRGIDDCLREQGYAMLLCNSDSDPEREKRQLLFMVDHRTEGVILCSGVSNENFLKTYRSHGMPLVMIGRTFDSPYADGCICGDNETGMYNSASYLIGHGHRSILYLDGPANAAGPMQRLAGYQKALAAHGIFPNAALIHQGEFSIQYGYDSVNRLLNEGVVFSAISAGSDLIAVGAVKALLKLGLRVPWDVEVIGFDNIDLSSIFDPNLSTVSKPHYAMAKQAARMLTNILRGDFPREKLVKTASELILRGTTRPDPKGDEKP